MILSKIRALLVVIQMAVTVSIVIILMYIFKSNNKAIRKVWASIQMKLLGIELEIKGEPDNEAQMLVLNHQSVLDIMIFEYIHQKNIAWVAKKEIADLFWFGHILKAPDMIIVERESKSSLIKLLKDSKNKIADKRPIAIFPEGTRSCGKRMKKFKAGAKFIAEKYNLTVQPIVLINSRQILDSQNFTQNPGIVKVIYLPSVKADKKTDWYKQIEEDMRSTLKKELV
ncbi:MAG: lysophospholipid acyltransferase family protein [Campylobacterota bacterium]|nr:lysophospholipid acyltransferase family protein [Campylobacterota bacterium]